MLNLDLPEEELVGTHKGCGGDVYKTDIDTDGNLLLDFTSWQCDKCKYVYLSESDMLKAVNPMCVLVWKTEAWSGMRYTALVPKAEAVGMERVRLA